MAATIVLTSAAGTNAPYKLGSPPDFGTLYSGRALDFDGVTDYVSIPQTDLGANTGTLSFWCYGTNLAGNGDAYIIAQQDTHNRLYVRIDDTLDKWYLGLSETANIDTSVTFEEDKWLNAVIVYNSGSYTFYIDDVSMKPVSGNAGNLI